MSESSNAVFLRFSADKLDQLAGRIVDCLGRLDYDGIWARGQETENAVGNLVLHLCGNMRQWIVSGIGGKPDIRVRDREFSARGEVQGKELRERLVATVGEATRILRELAPERLTDRVTVQKYDVTVMEAIYHVVEHFAEHTGQILFATKQLTGSDLGYYKHLQQAAHTEKTP
ncbi:MAG: DinB family protein [Bryobacteraceae bacterium]